MPASPAPVAALSEAEIEQRGLALAQRMVQAEAEQARKAAREEGLRAGREEAWPRPGAGRGGRQAQQARFQDVMDALLEALRRARGGDAGRGAGAGARGAGPHSGCASGCGAGDGLGASASSQLRHPGQVRVKLAPADLALLKGGHRPGRAAPQAAEVMWVADATIQGGCVLQTEAQPGRALATAGRGAGRSPVAAYRAHEATP